MTDYEAMLAYKTGDQDAFSYLFEKYRRVVKSWCFRHLQDNADAEEASQQVWLDLSQYLLNAKSGEDYISDEMKAGRFRNLAYRVAKNRSLDLIRNRDSQTSSEILMGPHEIENLSVEAESAPDYDLQVNDLLKTLDLDERVMILLKVEGYSDEELADKYDKPINTIKSDIFRIREKLRSVRA